MTQINHPLNLSESLFKKLIKIKDKSLVASLIIDGDSTLFILDGIHHITYRDAESLFSYCPKGKIQEISCEGRWQLSCRQSAKIGRLPKMIFKDNLFTEGMITDKDIETFVNEIKVVYTDGKPDVYFDIVKGRDIWRYYQEKNYYTDFSNECVSSALHGSCMRNADEEQLEFYTLYPDIINMVVLFHPKEDKVLGRALLWKLDNGKMYMDRVYACADKYYKMFNRHADDNGWFRYGCDKSYHNKAYAPGTDKRNNPVQLDLDVSFPNAQEMERMPYLDTFRYVAVHNGAIASVHGGVNNERINRYCRDTEGSWSICKAVRAEDTGRFGFDNNTGQIEGGEEARLTFINHGKHAGKYFEKADYAFYNHNGHWGNYGFPLDEIFYDEFAGENHHISHQRTAPDGKKYSERYEIKTISGVYHTRHSDDVCLLRKKNYGDPQQYEFRHLCKYDGFGWSLKTEEELANEKEIKSYANSCSDAFSSLASACDARPMSARERIITVDPDELPPLPF